MIEQVETCTWTQDLLGIWETSCDNMHEFTFDGVEENGYLWCPFCGGQIISVAYDDEVDEA